MTSKLLAFALTAFFISQAWAAPQLPFQGMLSSAMTLGHKMQEDFQDFFSDAASETQKAISSGINTFSSFTKPFTGGAFNLGHPSRGTGTSHNDEEQSGKGAFGNPLGSLLGGAFNTAPGSSKSGEEHSAKGAFGNPMGSLLGGAFNTAPGSSKSGEEQSEKGAFGNPMSSLLGGSFNTAPGSSKSGEEHSAKGAFGDTMGSLRGGSNIGGAVDSAPKASDSEN